MSASVMVARMRLCFRMDIVFIVLFVVEGPITVAVCVLADGREHQTEARRWFSVNYVCVTDCSKEAAKVHKKKLHLNKRKKATI